MPACGFGIFLAAVMFVISMSPSLLPRTWWWQGVASGILIEVGYGAGILIQWVVSHLWRAAGVKITAKKAWVKASKWLFFAGVAAWALWMLVRSYRSNNTSAHIMGFAPMSFTDYLAASAVAFIIAAAIAGLAMLIVGLWRRITKAIRRFMPIWAAGLIAAGLVVALVIFVVSDVLFERGMEYAYGAFATADQSDEPGIEQPVEPERSGSNASYEPWEAIGKQGRRFVTQGPRKADIEQVTGRDAMEPIRLYASLAEGRSLEEVAQVAVTELRRTNALDRSVLVIATTTGTGWVEEWAVQPVEYLTGGDCVTIATQYSYVPSAVAFLREFSKPAEASRVLFDAIMEEVNKLPEDERPAVYLQGVSLGAFGSQSLFEDEEDVREQIDGAVWAGTPGATPLWQSLTASRHLGSPEIAPVVNSARNTRFVTKPEDLDSDIYGREFPAWRFPRIAYMQHASDPVVWWDPAIISNVPDWLREPARADLNPDMQWTRMATFIQLSVDLPVAGLASDGHGHTYHREFIPVWASVLGLIHEDPLAGENPYRNADSSWINDVSLSRISTAIAEDLYP